MAEGAVDALDVSRLDGLPASCIKDKHRSPEGKWLAA